MSDVVFTLPNGRILLVPVSVVTKMHQYRQVKPMSKEQGGILSGVLRADCNEQISVTNPPSIEVLSITEPCCRDYATNTRFERRCKHHLTDLKNAAKMHKELVYLGEWHTHPEDNPSPSTIDLNSWQKSFNNKVAIVAIIGRVTNWWGIWMGDKVLRVKNCQ